MDQEETNPQQNRAASIVLPGRSVSADNDVENRKPETESHSSTRAAPRGYHLFQNGPIKLLSGALNAEIPRRPGSRNSRSHLVTPEFAPKAEGNSRISMAPSSLLASRVTDYRKWVLAVQPPPGEEEEPLEEEYPSASALLRAETPEDVYAKAMTNSGGTPLEDLITLEDLQKIMKSFATVTVDFFSSSPGDEATVEGSRGGRSESTFTRPDEISRFPGAPEQKFDRKLSTEEFVEAVQRVIPSATSQSILELVNKVDYEGIGAITWNELSTFLVSQTSHRTFLSQAGAEFTHTPEPINCFMDNMHQIVSCYCMDPSAKLIITGGQEGTVRAWSRTTLSFRGILFSTDSWITGVHYSSRTTGRILYVTTMDREIFLLDGSSFEVLRVFRGRPVEDTTNSLVYAHDTTRMVNIGGVTLPSRKALERQLADAAKLNEKRQQELASGAETITSASAYEALNFDSMPVTGQGNGPYVERLMEECVLAGLVDPVTCSAYNNSHLDEEVILLGTRTGEIYFYILHSRSNKKVLLSHHILRVHSERVNKMTFLYSMNALVSCADDGKVVVTSMVNGQPIRTFQSTQQHHHVAVRDFSIHPYFKMMVTTGPERYGLVWEFSQESPVAVLEAHNSPCRCCTFSVKNSQVVTVGVDGSIFVFDLNGFHLSQKIEPGFAYSPFAITCATSGSLLCFRRYPYHLRIKRHKTSSCPEKYRGHTAPMVNILYTKTFDQIVTVDMEFTVMTWARKTGTNVFTFILNGYSDSATLSSAHLTCAALDAAQRRLITGYQNGAVVVWNVVNGQAINFITAGMEETTSDSPPSIHPQTGSGDGQSKRKKAGGHTLNNGAHRPVRTVSSLVRHGSTFFLFSIYDTLYIVRESSNYTVATASSWKVPPTYGEVTGMIQVTPQVIACGTSLGAVFFFHVLSEKQDGAVRWLPDPAAALEGIIDLNFATGLAENRLTLKRQTISSMSLAAQQLIPSLSSPAQKSGKQGHHLSRVTQMFLMPAVSSNTFMTVHADGNIALWHLFRRVFLGSLNLIAAGVDEGKDRSGNLVVAIDDARHLLIFGDEGGNIHVCEFHMELLGSEKEEATTLSLGNPMMHFAMAREERSAGRTEYSDTITEMGDNSHPPFEQRINASPTTANQAGNEANHEDLENIEIMKENEDTKNTLPEIKRNTASRYFQERAIHIMDKFERVNVFGTNIRSISSLIIADSPVKLTKKPTDQLWYNQNKDSADQVEEPDEPVIICTGADSYSRCFTIRGEPIGELGMNPWILSEKGSYQYMGEPASGEPLGTSFTLENGWYYDFLTEGLLAARRTSLGVTRKSRARSQHSGSNTNLVELPRYPMPSKPSSAKEGRDESGTARDSTVHLATSLRNMSEVELQNTVTALTEAQQGEDKQEEEKTVCVNFSDEPPGFRHHPGKRIDTVIRRSLRQRILVDAEPFKGVLKRRFLRDIRPPNQVADDYRETTPPPMTSAEAQFLGIIENVFSANKLAGGSPKGEHQCAESFTIPGAASNEHATVSVLSDDTITGLGRQASGVPRPQTGGVPPPPIQRVQSTVSLSLPLDDSSDQMKARMSFLAQDGTEAKAIHGDTPEKLGANMSKAKATDGLESLLPNPPPMQRRLSSPREDGTELKNTPDLGTGTGTGQLRSVTSFRQTARSSSRTARLPCRESRSQRPKYVTLPGKTKTVEASNSSTSDAEEFTDPKALIQHHLIEKRQQILDSGCTDNSKRLIENEMNTFSGDGRSRREETLGGLAMMGPVVEKVVEHHKKERGPAALSGALSFIADISSRMYVPPVEEIEAPVGSKSRDEVQAWRDHLSRLQKNAEAKPRGMH